MAGIPEPVSPSRRTHRNPKSLRPSQQAQRRRDEALQRQQTARDDANAKARQLALQALSMEAVQSRAGPDLEMAEGSAERRQHHHHAVTGENHHAELTREHWSRQLMRPEWMIDVPKDLARDWYVLPRPEGQRCLLISSGGQTVARMRNGVQLMRFPSALPGGSRHTQLSSDTYCILDAIFHPANQTFYVLDMMCWKGYALYDCSAEFRLFWVNSKLAETDAAQAGSNYNRYSIVALPAFVANTGGLTSATSGPVPFVRDGVYFLHKEGHYRLGQSPLALLWKDASCSRYLLDTDMNGNVLPQQQVVLEYQEEGTVVTADEEPVVLGRLAQEAMASLGSTLKPGKMLRFNIGPGGMQLEDGHPVVADLQYDGGAHARRGRADTISKILFQYHVRRQPLSLQTLIEASQADDTMHA